MHAGWTHTHRGVISNVDEKYIITGCVFNNDFTYLGNKETMFNKSTEEQVKEYARCMKTHFTLYKHMCE